ncbi:MAG: DUF2971 domain-containing protein [Syntrophales bacterium LBB04]|nr:DUF2971 domain-containing protein [Syntrophales bacterium LBB04]
MKKFRARYAHYKGLSKKQAESDLRQIITRKGRIDPEFIRSWKGVLKKANKELEESGVFCLSECNNNILMWSHYADGHKGFCVEFERKPDNDLGDYDRTRKVRYGVEYPVASPLDPKAYDYKFFLKAANWKYEKEWRLLNERGNAAIPLSARISAIIFGLRMTARHKSEIRWILPGIQYRQCTKARNKFRLRIVDL